MGMAPYATQSTPPPATTLERPAETPADSARVLAGWDKGFVLRSQDGRHELAIHGLLQVRARAFEGADDARDDDIDLAAMRLELEGRLDGRWLFLLEPRFDASSTKVDEAWIGVDLGESRNLRAGRIKVPLGMEEMQPRRWRDFVQKSLLAQFVPGEDHGVGWFQGTKTTTWQWGATATNGTGGAEQDDAKELAARGVWRPWTTESHALRGTQFALGASWGSGEADLGGKGLLNEAGVAFASLDDEARLDGERLRLDAEVAWSHDRHEARLEWLRQAAELSDGVLGDTAVAQGYSVMLSRMLTPHAKSMYGFSPATPLDDGGAWQAVARWTHLDFDDGWTASGALDAASDPGAVDSFDLGINWWAGPNTVLRIHAVHTRYADAIAIDGEQVESEDALLVGWQLHF